MKSIFLSVLLIHFVLLTPLTSIKGFQQKDYNNRILKPRIINITDLGADPEDEQSMVRQLVCANEFDIDDLIVTTSCWKKTQTNISMLDKIIDAYEKAFPNLSVYADELANFLSKLRLYDIPGQDDAVEWIAKNFPDVFNIRATAVYGWQPSDEYPWQSAIMVLPIYRLIVV